MKKKLYTLTKVFLGLYILVCILLYSFQEKIIFLPQKLDKNFQFEFENDFEELNIKSNDNSIINGLLFKANNSKGLIFYFHGNAGSLKNWGEVAKLYTNLNYDVFIFDYRSYGKSEGKINNQEQLFKDSQIVYNNLKQKYNEKNIIVLGYSIGTGMASKLASENNPSHLILQAPYYNLSDLIENKYPFIPTFILKYKFETNKYLSNCKMPITIFHGNKDNVIYYESSEKLKNEFKDQIELITLKNEGHNGITNNLKYAVSIMRILKNN